MLILATASTRLLLAMKVITGGMSFLLGTLVSWW
jgi:hypothetical protein